MACGDQPTLLDFFLNYNFWDGIVCFYNDQLGASVTFFIFAGVTAMTLYISTGSIIVPAVIGIITAGVAFALLPAYGIEVALMVIVLVAGGAMYLLAKRSGENR